MKIRYVIGGTGYGKSHYLFRNILQEAEKDLGKKYYVIVPEQVNLLVQRELVNMSRAGSLFNVDVLSFLRLAHRTFAEVGKKERLILEDTGKSMVVKKLLNRFGTEFRYFKKVSGKAGFTEDMKSLITELMQYDVSLSDIETLLKDETLSPVIKAKLHDTKLIFEAFQEYKKEKYIVAEKLLDELSDAIENSNLYRNAVFLFDGFTGFTPTQLKVIDRLMGKAKAMYFAFTMDKETYYEAETPDYKLFYLSKSMILKLNALAEKRGIGIASPIVLTPYRERGAISKIENDLFRLKKAETFLDKKNQVSVTVCKNPKEEAYHVLTEIKTLVKEKGYRYKEIAVVAGDLEEYGDLLYGIFTKRGLPSFLDRKKSMMDNAFITFVRASLSVMQENFSYESIMRYLRSGLSGFLHIDIDRFENFLLAKGIKGERRFRNSFLKSRIPDQRTEKEKNKEERIEYMRETIWKQFAPLLEVFRDKEKNTKERTLALYRFIKVHRIEEKLYVMSGRFEKEGNTILSKEYAACYKMVMEIFEKLIELLGEEFFSLEDYVKILEAGFLEGKAGFIPSGLDQVVIGDLRRTRFAGIKALFFVGVNDGKVPKTTAKKGLFTDREREKISKIVELAPTAREKSFMELFYLYLLFSKPEELLFLSYSSNTADGKLQRPSYILEKVLALFEGKQRKNLKNGTPDFVTEIRKDGGFDLLLRMLKNGKKPDEKEIALVRYALEQKENAYHNLVLGFKEGPIGEKLDKELARKLYGNLKGSITRLESFVACPFSHFVKYGLRLKEREEYALRSVDLGNLYHDVLERFSEKTLNGGGFSSLTEGDRVRFANESLLETIKQNFDLLLEIGRNQYRFEKIRRLIDRTVWAIHHQVRAGEFQPTLFEEAFLAENMRGRIDRIDTVISDFLPDGSLLHESKEERLRKYNKVEYARVIDYKSGKKVFDSNEAYYGLDLQLIAYLKHITGLLNKRQGHEKNLIVPVGAYYYHMENPTRDKGEGEDAFLKELRLNGFTLAEPYALYLTDTHLASQKETKFKFEPSVKSNVIPVSTKKDGELSKVGTLFSREDLREWTKYSGSVMKEIREDILTGEIRPHPYQLGEKKGCDYCPYETLCRFHARLDGYAYRKLEGLSKEEVLKKIREKNEKKLDEGAKSGH